MEKRYRARALLCLTIVVLLATAASGQTYVSRFGAGGPGTNWNNAYQTITAAVTAVAVGGMGGDIWVQRGIYNEQVNIPAMPPGVPGIRLYGGFHGWEGPPNFAARNFRTNPTVIDGGGFPGPVVIFQPGCDAARDALDGFVIRNGLNPNGAGGGVSILDRAYPAATNSATIANCTITACVASSGGGIALRSVAPSQILGNEIYGCSALGGGGGNFVLGHGGGIYAESAPTVISRNRIGKFGCDQYPNTATLNGGGIAVINGEIQILHNLIYLNHADNYGGGIYTLACRGDSRIVNNQVEHNNANGAGGGICVQTGAPWLLSNTLFDNRVPAGGWCGGLAFIDVGAFLLGNNIVAGNLDSQVEARPPAPPGHTVDYNCVDGGWALYVGVSSGPLDLFADPLLTPAGCAATVSHLLQVSPCLNRGNNAWAALVVSGRDLDGEDRQDLSLAIDIGADEYYSPLQIVAVPGTYATIQEALDRTGPDRTIQVTSGIYMENIVMRPCVTLLGLGTPEISGTMLNTTVTVPHDVTCTIQGFKLSNGHAIQGGVVNVGTCAVTTVAGCTIQDGTAEMDLGLFPNDPLGSGAGGLMHWAANSQGEVRESILFNGNATALALPGVQGLGGGIAMEGGASPTITRCSIKTSHASWSGGGLWLSGAGTNPSVELSEFRQNSAGWGGGIYQRAGANPTVCNNLIVENTAAVTGGGVAVFDGGNLGAYTSNTIALNNGPALPAATQLAILGTNSLGKFVNNILYGTRIGIAEGYGTIVNRHHNCVWPDMAAPDLNAVPLLFFPTYHLKPTSPCKNAGSTAAGDQCGDVDIDGQPRVSVTIDIGADEYYSLTGVPETPEAAWSLRASPNPFNPSTSIEFAVPRAGQVEVRIFDIRGREVTRLDAGSVTVGRHEILWGGRDDRGGALGSGVFFAVLYLDGTQVGTSEKICLVK
jgi:hypothetical protein